MKHGKLLKLNQLHLRLSIIMSPEEHDLKKIYLIRFSVIFVVPKS